MMNIHDAMYAAYSAKKQSDLNTANEVADTTAAREAGDNEAADNRAAAERTNSLAYRLATARRNPGGGIRLGMKRKGFTANNAGIGLNRANSASSLDRRKAELRAKAKQAHAQQYSSPYIGYEGGTSPIVSTTIGDPIMQRYY